MKKVMSLFILVVLAIVLSGFSQGAFAQEFDEFGVAYELAVEKLNQKKLTYELIDGVEDKERFILFRGQEKGYLIYDRFAEIYLEYSVDDDSPYESVSGKKIYVAPTYYYQLDEGKYFDARLGNELRAEDVESLKVFSIEFTENIQAQKQIDEILISEEKETVTPHIHDYDDHHECDDHDHQVMSSPSGGNKIPYSYYYENLRFNMGNNVLGTCSFVAAGMILSYYDSIYNDNIVPEQFDLPGTNRTGTGNFNPQQPFNGWSEIYPETFEQSPGVSDAFHLQTINEMNTTAMNIDQTATLISRYLDDAGVSYSKKQWNWWEGLFTSKYQWVKNGIDSGNPVYIHFTGTDTALDSRDLNHAVVGYEYDDVGVFVNFGWRGTYTRTNIHNYTLQNVLYFKVNDNPSTIWNYEWTSTNGANGVMSIDGTVVCYHNIEIFPVNDTYHFIGCLFCGNDQFHIEHSYVNGICTVCNHSHVNHTLGSTWYGTATSHYRKCTTCSINVYCNLEATVTSITSTQHTLSCANGYSRTSSHTYNSQNVCTVCGHQTSHVHAYTSSYLPYFSTQHRAYCSCGAYVLRPHIGFAPIDPWDPVYCYHCGYEMDDGGIIGIFRKEDFEIHEEGGCCS